MLFPCKEKVNNLEFYGMKKSKLLILSIPLILSSCQKGENSQSSTNSEGSFISSSVEESSSDHAISSELQKCLDLIVNARKDYENPLSENEIIKNAGFSSNETLKADTDTLLRLLKGAFSSLMEKKEKVGSRLYAGYFGSQDSIYTDSAEGKEAFNWFNSYGLWGSSPYYGDMEIDSSVTKTYLQRIFSYLGSSAKNDFYTYSNEDRLFDSSMTTKWNESYYEQRMVDQTNIYDFYVNFFNKQAPALYKDYSNGVGLESFKQYADTIKNSTTSNIWDDMLEVSTNTGSYLFSFAEIGVSSDYPIILSAENFYKAFTSESVKETTINSIFSSFGYDENTSKSLTSSLTSAFEKIASHGESSYGGNASFEKYFQAQVGEGNAYITSTDKFSSSLFSYLSDGISEENIESIKAFYIATLAFNYSALLPTSIREGLGLTSEGEKGTFLKLTSTALQSYFVNTYYASEVGKKSIDKAFSLGKEVASTIKERLSVNNWLTKDGQEAISKKLSNLDFSISGLTDTNKSYKVTLDTSSLASALKDGYVCFWNDFREESKTLTKLSLNERYTDLFLPNAYYTDKTNRITITTALITSYGDDLINLSNERLYGPFTVVLSHEITHSIDSSCIYYDENGNYVEGSILSEKDIQAYQEKQDKVKKVHLFEAMPAALQDPSTTLGEDIADIGGLTIAETIYGKYTNETNWDSFYKETSRHFFTACSSSEWEKTYYEDTHSWGKARVNSLLSNSKNFSTYYKLSENDGMYLSSDDQVVVW